MPKLPKKYKDLRRYVLFKDLRRLLSYLTWMLLWLSGALFYNSNHTTYPKARLMLGWKLALWMAVSAVAGFFIFRIYTFFTDRTYRGVICRSDLTHTYEASRDPGLSNATDWDFRLNTRLFVDSPDYTKPRRVHFEEKMGFYFYYYEGTEVIKFHGLPYPLAVGNFHKDALPRICLACGRIAQTESTQCEVCFHSLVDPKDLSPTLFDEE